MSTRHTGRVWISANWVRRWCGWWVGEAGVVEYRRVFFCLARRGGCGAERLFAS